MDEQTRINNLTPPAEGFDCVIDTDAYNETDDQFAISYLLKSGRCMPQTINISKEKLFVNA